MSIEIFLMILGAALVHATWNALVKSDGDRLGLIKMMFRTPNSGCRFVSSRSSPCRLRKAGLIWSPARP
jgi:hypothetical protein